MAWSHPHCRILARQSDNPSAHAAARAGGLDASDMVAISGLHAWDGPAAVWARKTAAFDTPGAEERPRLLARRWRAATEPIIVDAWTEETGLDVRMAGLLASRAHPIMQSSWTRLTEDGGGLLVTQSPSMGDWRDDGAPAVADLRCHWAMAVTGRSPWHIAALIGGSRLEIRTVPFETAVATDLIDRATSWWDTYIKDKGSGAPEPGPVPGDAATVRRLFAVTDREAAQQMPAADLRELTLDMLAAQEAAQDAQDAKSIVQARIIAAVGSAEVLTDEVDKPWLTIRPTGKASPRRLRELYPDLADDYIIDELHEAVNVDALTADHPEAARAIRTRGVRVLKHARLQVAADEETDA